MNRVEQDGRHRDMGEHREDHGDASQHFDAEVFSRRRDLGIHGFEDVMERGCLLAATPRFNRAIILFPRAMPGNSIHW